MTNPEKNPTRYRVTITLNGTVQTYTGSRAYVARIRRAAFRMGHGMHNIERIAP